MSASANLFQTAIDPQIDYKVLAQPENIEEPLLQSITALSLERNLAEICIQYCSLSKALLESYARYLGACDYEDPKWQLIQLASTRFYLNKMQDCAQMISDLSTSLSATIPVPSLDEITSFRSLLTAQGLPFAEFEVLKRRGYSDEEISEFSTAFSLVDDEYFGCYTSLPDTITLLSLSLAASAHSLPNPPIGHIVAALNFDPDTVNLKSKGNDITCYITLPASHSIKDIALKTIRLNEALSPLSFKIQKLPNGASQLALKFKREEINSILSAGLNEVIITGSLMDKTVFSGVNIVRIIP